MLVCGQCCDTTGQHVDAAPGSHRDAVGIGAAEAGREHVPTGMPLQYHARWYYTLFL